MTLGELPVTWMRSPCERCRWPRNSGVKGEQSARCDQ